jgi:hypothetical protein
MEKSGPTRERPTCAPMHPPEAVSELALDEKIWEERVAPLLDAQLRADADHDPHPAANAIFRQ